MYFEGKLTISPVEVAQIEHVKPTKAFKRMFYYMTFGGVSDKLEKETFTAVSILQQINMMFLNSGVDNIIRLSHDDIDFYLDTEGKEGDLKDAFDKYDIEMNDAMSIHFEKLVMVLEHDDDKFKYLVEVNINRTHEVGEHPIEIKISGLLKEFKSESEDRDKLKAKMESVFSTQEQFNTYKIDKKQSFDNFVDSIKLNINKFMKVDDVQHNTMSKIVIPKNKVATKAGIPHVNTSGYHGMYYGYYGFNDYLYYNMMWSTMCHDHHVVVDDAHYETETGENLGHMEDMDTSSDYFNEDVDSASTEDVFQGAEDTDSSSDSDDSGGGWFDSSDSGDSDSGGSSCSSCSSCGGD